MARFGEDFLLTPFQVKVRAAALKKEDDMTPDEMIEVIQAWKDGKLIECKAHSNKSWIPVPNPLWDFAECDYRIKPEPKKPREWSIALGVNGEVLGVGPGYAGAIVEVKKPIQQVSEVICVREVLE